MKVGRFHATTRNCSSRHNRARVVDTTGGVGRLDASRKRKLLLVRRPHEGSEHYGRTPDARHADVDMIKEGSPPLN